MGGLSSFTDWVGDTIDSAFDAVGDAFEWVSDKVKDVWDSNLGKIAIIAAVAYFAWAALPEAAASTSVEAGAAIEGTGVAAAGAGELAVTAPGVVAEAGVGALEAAEAASFLEPVAAAAPELAVTGTELGISGVTGAGEVGALDAATAWAAENPMLAYGGMMAGGQAISGYMQGQQMKEIEEQRLKEEQEKRDRQNVWGVNYAEGGEAISAGDRLKDLNRDYFDASAPINPAVQNYQIASERQRAGVLDQVTSTANPAQFAHKPTPGAS